MSGRKTSETLLGDFRTDSPMLVLVALAVPVGVISALVAKALLSLIAEITNLVFFRRLSPVSFASASSSRRLGHSRAGHRCAHDRADGAIRFGKNSRPRNSRSARSDSSGPQQN
jgi:hypothetical protein